MAPTSYVNPMMGGPQHRVHASAYLNGGNNNRAANDPAVADIEDYVALSYLKEFINSIVARPNTYEKGITEITCIVNTYLDEDECILELIVNQIVDQVSGLGFFIFLNCFSFQSIIDVDFRYNGVKLCHHFMEQLRPTASNQTFKDLVFKR